MNSTRRLHLELAAVGQLGKQLSELGNPTLSKFLYGDGPSLADRLATSVEHSKATHCEIINKVSEALTMKKFTIRPAGLREVIE